MEKFYIESCGSCVSYETDIPLYYFISKNKKYIEFPNICIHTNDVNCIEYKVIYKDCDTNSKKLICTDKEILIHHPKEDLTPTNIIYMGNYLIESQFGKNNKITCHSACIEKNGEATLLLGGAGAGKTSLALNLCLSHGFKLISNDKTVIGLENGKLHTYGGTKFINLRYKSVEQNLPQLLYLFDLKNKEKWTNKICISADELGIEEQYKTCPIKNVFLVHVDFRENFNCMHGDNWRNNFILYNNLTEQIRAANSTFVNKFGHPIGFVPSYDTIETYNKRIDLINCINTNENYKYLSGNLNDITDYINSSYFNENSKQFIKQLKRKGEY